MRVFYTLAMQKKGAAGKDFQLNPFDIFLAACRGRAFHSPRCADACFWLC